MGNKKLVTLDILEELSSKQKTYINAEINDALTMLGSLAQLIQDQNNEIIALKNKLAKYDERFGYPESDTGDWSKAFLLIDPDESEDESDNS